tara:strand:+ start:857 stop:1093 length:237 start_codon:yes stop_codon:yes gene_type:complete
MKISIDIKYLEIALTVTGYYSPGESEITYVSSDGSGYPGSPAEFESHIILCGDQDIIGILHYETIEEIEALILNKMEI